MQRVAVLSLALLFCLAAIAQADPVVVLGTYNIAPGQTKVAIPMYVYQNTATGNFTGTPNPHSGVQGLDLNVTLADGSGFGSNGGPVFHAGTALGANSAYVGSPANPLAGGDPITGTIFQTGLTGGATLTGPADNGNSTSQDLEIILTVNGGFATMSSNSGAPSLLATLYVDTVGVAPNTNWAISIGQNYNDTFLPLNGPLDFADAGAMNTQLGDGIIHILGVPEPSTITMGLFAMAGFVAMLLGRRHRA